MSVGDLVCRWKYLAFLPYSGLFARRIVLVARVVLGTRASLKMD